MPRGLRRRLAAILSAAVERLDPPAPVALIAPARDGVEVYAPPRLRPEIWRNAHEGEVLMSELAIPLDVSALERVREAM